LRLPPSTAGRWTLRLLQAPTPSVLTPPSRRGAAPSQDGASNPKPAPARGGRLPVAGAVARPAPRPPAAAASPAPPSPPPPRGRRRPAARRRCRRLGGRQRGQEAWGAAGGRGGREEGHGPRHAREPLRRRRAQRAPAPARAAGGAEGLHGAPRRLTARSGTVNSAPELLIVWNFGFGIGYEHSVTNLKCMVISCGIFLIRLLQIPLLTGRLALFPLYVFFLAGWRIGPALTTRC